MIAFTAVSTSPTSAARNADAPSAKLAHIGLPLITPPETATGVWGCEWVVTYTADACLFLHHHERVLAEHRAVVIVIVCHAQPESRD
ncbi:hypothetical protein ACGFYQ_40880 [Streptomyces sp. NPDC048258]|uniref:hypothetical protein n=1 Tax=Streptomyces sp. NPDC048258 TaxID=3365527 RepID=UPI003714451B